MFGWPFPKTPCGANESRSDRSIEDPSCNSGGSPSKNPDIATSHGPSMMRDPTWFRLVPAASPDRYAPRPAAAPTRPRLSQPGSAFAIALPERKSSSRWRTRRCHLRQFHGLSTRAQYSLRVLTIAPGLRRLCQPRHPTWGELVRARIGRDADQDGADDILDRRHARTRHHRDRRGEHPHWHDDFGRDLQQALPGYRTTNGLSGLGSWSVQPEDHVSQARLLDGFHRRRDLDAIRVE